MKKSDPPKALGNDDVAALPRRFSSEGDKTPLGRSVTARAVFWIGVVFIVAALVVVWGAVMKNQDLSATLQEKEQQIIALKKRIDSQQTENEELKKTVTTMHHQTEGAGASEEFIWNFVKQRNPRVPSIVAKEIAKNVLSFSKKNYIPPCLAIGVIEVESTYNPMAVSSKDARGLMQVLHSVWSEKIDDKYDLFEIDHNIRVGCEILNELLQKQSIQKTLYAYLGEKDGEYLKKILTVAITFEIERVRQAMPELENEEASAQKTDKQSSNKRRN